MAEVKIRGIAKAYSSGVPVLKGVDLDIHAGELFFLLGPSGCGKSTLLRILAGLVKPDSGTISFDGADILSLPPEKRRAAMVFQNYALWPNVLLPPSLHRSPECRTANRQACRVSIWTKICAAVFSTVRSVRLCALLSSPKQKCAVRAAKRL